MHSGSTLFGGCANFRELCPRAHEKLSVSGFHITKGKVITNMHVSSRDKKRKGIKKDGIKRYKRNLKKHGIQLFKPYRQRNLFFGFLHPYGRYISVEYAKVKLGQKVTIAHLKQGSKPLLVLVEVCNELVDGYLLPSLKHGRTRRLKARLLFLLSQYKRVDESTRRVCHAQWCPHTTDAEPDAINGLGPDTQTQRCNRRRRT